MANSVNHRIWLGITLVVLGGLFLLDNYGVINFDIPYWIFKWQSILILIGILLIVNSRNKSVGLILITIGTLGFFPELWPLLLILLGIFILYKRKDNWNSRFDRRKMFGERGPHNPPPGAADGEGFKEHSRFRQSAEFSKDIINDVAIFGGGKKMVQSDNFKGGNVTAVFGGSQIDLSDCKLASGENTLDVFAMFGGSDIIAPRDWKINIQVVPIFGGFNDKRIHDPNLVPDPEKVLVIKGLVIFGGGSIKS